MDAKRLEELIASDVKVTVTDIGVNTEGIAVITVETERGECGDISISELYARYEGY